jgi:hypothetical protein
MFQLALSKFSEVAESVASEEVLESAGDRETATELDGIESRATLNSAVPPASLGFAGASIFVTIDA